MMRPYLERSPHPARASGEVGYGLGFESWDYGARVGHIGAGKGFSSALYRFPKEGISYIELSTGGFGMNEIELNRIKAIIERNGAASPDVLDQCRR
jgi:CubicO group peptidase (beta-lactamase class C family)